MRKSTPLLAVFIGAFTVLCGLRLALGAFYLGLFEVFGLGRFLPISSAWVLLVAAGVVSVGAGIVNNSTSPAAVPDSGGVWLLGAGLIGLVGFSRCCRSVA